MKTAYVALLVGVLMLSTAEAGDETMSKRSDALMSALNVEQARDTVLSDRTESGLSGLKFKMVGALTVSHRQALEDGENDIDDELTFSNDKGVAKAFGKVKYRKTSKAAQLALFEDLAMNSLPMNLLLERYEIDKKGPGDLCIADKLKERVHFIRGNVAVSVRSEDAEVNAKELARHMDQVLVEGN
ncbi:MAG: hypothetical protein V2A34_04565 [Lentisphaerota bacterium]